MTIKLTDIPRRILIWDVETSPIPTWVWGFGEQVVRHGQVMDSHPHKVQNIISLAYRFNDNTPTQVLNWGYEEQDSRALVSAFDEIIKEADIVIGKNSDRFDNKRLNMQRWLHRLDAMPDWMEKTDDLEKLIRRDLGSPSYALDYLDKLNGGTGKTKMEFSDWIHILEKTPVEGPIAFEKMQMYNKKDVDDTYSLLESVWAYVRPKHSAQPDKFIMDGTPCCVSCGSQDVFKNGTRRLGASIYQKWHCNGHGGYAGRSLIKRLPSPPKLRM